ncbi:MAG: hypothetical protein U0790_28380 [Isosphaeraceae bacterium]
MDLLGRARGFLKGLSTPPVDRVQYYSVVCPQGHRVRGQRTEGYQALRCPACGEGVFVLPSSPLPEPEPPPKSASRRAPVRRPVVEDAPLELKDPDEVTVDVADRLNRPSEAEIEWDDDATETPPPAPTERRVSPEVDTGPPARARKPRPAAPTGESRPSRPPSAVPPRPRATPGVADGADAGPDWSPGGQALPDAGRAGRRARRVSRPVLIIAGLIVLVAGSVTYRTWRSRRHLLPEVAAVGRTEGIPALEEGKFDKAYQLLAKARDAVDVLGGDVEGAEEIRHAADEAGVFVDLLSDSLETLLEEAARTRPQEWANRFDDLYKGRSVIVQATIVATPASGVAGRYELDYVVLPPGEGAGERRFARLDISDLQAITLAQPKVGDHVVFGARLASFAYDSDRESFVIRFDPNSGVSIRYTRALEALGWPTGTLIPQGDAEGEGAAE